MKSYTLSAEATRDLDSIADWLDETAGLRVSMHVAQHLHKEIAFLSKNPSAGHTRTDLTRMPVKFWPVFSWLIIYNPVNRPLEIIRVLHGSRDVEDILEPK